jgi:hypothetical protein
VRDHDVPRRGEIQTSAIVRAMGPRDRMKE